MIDPASHSLSAASCIFLLEYLPEGREGDEGDALLESRASRRPVWRRGIDARSVVQHLTAPA